MFSRIGSSSVTLPKELIFIGSTPGVINFSRSHDFVSFNFNSLLNCNFDSKNNSLHFFVEPSFSATSKRLSRKAKALAGLSVRLLENFFQGFKGGFKETLELEGVGFKVNHSKEGKLLVFDMGFSHQYFVCLPKDIEVISIIQNKLTFSSISKQALGNFCAFLHSSLRGKDPYHGKGLKFVNRPYLRKELKKK